MICRFLMEQRNWSCAKARSHFEVYRGELMSDSQNSNQYLLNDLEGRDRSYDPMILPSKPQQCSPSFSEGACKSILEEIDAGSTDEEKVRIAKKAIMELAKANRAYELNDQHKNEEIAWYRGNPEFLV